LIGNNILNQIECVIDYPNRLLKLPNTNIVFYLNKEEEEYKDIVTKEINSLETYENEIFDSELIIIDENTPKPDKQKILNVINSYQDIFYQEGTDLTFTNEIKHKIHTTNDIPIYSKLYRYPEIHKKEVNTQIQEMLEQGIIRPSTSPYNSPLWIVPKKIDNSGKEKWRLVIDYRKLNQITVTDRYPIPNIEDIFDKLGRAQYFSTIDLAKGFHQIEMDPQDIKKTAFSTPNGHYEFLRMPFGLKNAPATFQRMVNNVLKDYIGKICLVYLDDIIIFSTSIEEHIVYIKKIFEKLREANLKVQIAKCKFLAKETEFLGHIVTNEGIKTNPNKVAAIQKIPLPKTQKEIKSFLGMSGYYRKFIKDYSKIAHDIVKYLKKNSKININDPKYIESFNKLKLLLQSDPILVHPDFSKQFTLITDASNFALGAVLMQQNKTIAYASRSLNDHEKNYSTIEKELLGIVWAVKYFRPYLYGRKFTIKTDHRPLVWLNNLKEPNSKLQRWKIQLNEYDYEIDYIKGKENFVADELSRIININEIAPIEKNNDLNETNQILVTADVHVNANEIIGNIENQSEFEEELELDMSLDNISVSNNVDDLETIHSAESDAQDFIYFSEKPLNLFKNQVIISINTVEEEKIKTIFNKIRTEITINNENKLLNLMQKIIPTKGLVAVFIKNNSLFLYFQDLYRQYFSRNTNLKILRCTKILPDIEDKEELLQIIEETHLENNHRGINEIFEELRNKIYTPNLLKEINKYINNCKICNLAKYDRKPLKHNLNITETPTITNDTIHIDIWFPQRHTMYLTSIDKLTKYGTAHPLKDRTWVSILEALKNRTQYLGKPRKLIFDNELNTATVRQYLEENNIEYHITTPYNKTGNSDVERLHLTLNEHIRLFNADPNNTDNMEERVHKAILAYNNTIHTTHNKRPIDFLNNSLSKEEIKEIAKKLVEKKTKIIDETNIRHHNRNHVQFENKYVKNYRVSKAKPRYIQLDHINRQNNHIITDRNKKYYKTQVKRKYKYQ